MKRLGLIACATLAVVLLPASAQAAVPTLGAVAANEIGSESALLEGNLNPNGLASDYRFEYVVLSAFSETGFNTAAASPLTGAGSGSVTTEVSAAIGGLIPDTTYYYRLSATNSSGTATGKPSTFNTSHGLELSCEGDDCQSLPPAPLDPTLTTLLQGLGNPSVRYHQLNHYKKPKHKHKPHKKHHKKHKSHHGGRR